MGNNMGSARQFQQSKKAKFKRLWTDRTELERWLFGILILVVTVFILTFAAWQQTLIPWETEYGSVAEWVGAIATAAGLGWAVYTLRVNNREQKSRSLSQLRAEASRVSIVWDKNVEHKMAFYQDSKFNEQRWIYRGEIHNDSTYPVNGFSIFFNDINGTFYKQNGEPRKPGDTPRILIESILPGEKKTFEFPISWNDKTIDNDHYRVAQAAYFVWSDSLGNSWRKERDELKLQTAWY